MSQPATVQKNASTIHTDHIQHVATSYIDYSIYNMFENVTNSCPG